jgi:hypothetical protein
MFNHNPKVLFDQKHGLNPTFFPNNPAAALVLL